MARKLRGKQPDVARKVEGFILKAAITGIVLLTLFQAIMLNDTARVFLNYTSKLEGQSLDESGLLTTTGKLIIRIENEEVFPEVLLLVNGEPVAAFDRKEIGVQVRNNDLVEVDASRLKERSIYLSIVGVSDNVIQPTIGMRVRARNKIQVISRVKLK